MENLEWFTCEGQVEAINQAGEEVITISPLMNQAICAKWGEKYVPGRYWIATHNNETVTQGHAPNLPAAKKAALAALKPYNEQTN